MTTWYKKLRMAVAIAACAFALAATGAQAQDRAAASPTELAPVDELVLEQEQLAGKFRNFEQVLLRLAKLTETTDPERAALLRKAFAQSKERLLDTQFGQLVDLLKQDRLANAVAGQTSLEAELAKLLELLLSEERQERIRQERERIKEQIRQLTELINRQTQLAAQTARSGELDGLAPSQGKLADDTAQMAKSMKADDKPAEQGDGEPPEADDSGSPAERETDPMPRGDEKEGGKQSSKPPMDDEAQPDEPSSKPSDENQPGEAQGEQAQPGQQGQPGQPGQPGQQGPPSGESSPSESQPANPAQERVEAAQDRMRRAQQRLDRAEREGAVDEQEAAIRELEQAKAELEKILRQLREEEIARTLAMLEARFRKMHEMQLEVYEGTRRLDAVPSEERRRDDEIESSRLGRKESMIIIEAEKALMVLREDASSVAFPEAVEQMRTDMEQVVVRLSRFDVGQITQTIERDILAALEEMIAALEQAQQDLEERKQEGQPAQPGEPQEPALVDRIQELKMIRSLQMRINSRTQMYAGQVADDELGQADAPEVLEALQQLAEQQNRVYRATHDIVEGRNR